MEGRQSFFLGPQDECPQCGDDYYVKDAPADQEYQGVLVKGDKALICKRCERLGLDDGTLVLTHVDPPRKGWFVVKALPHTSTQCSCMVTQSWSEVIGLVGYEPNRFRIAFIQEDITCYGDYLARAFMEDGPCNEYFYEDDFWWQAYQDGVTEFRIFRNKVDREGVTLTLPSNLEYEEYEDCITDVTNPMVYANEKSYNSSIFVGTQQKSKVVPHMLLKSVYYYPDTSLRWYTSLLEAERAWKNVDVMQPGQYTVEWTPKKKSNKGIP